MRRLTLTYFLATLLFTFNYGGANAQDKTPGEGVEKILIIGEGFDAGSYTIKVVMDVTIKYRFSTLLGDHVEKFTPKYDVSSAQVFENKTGELLFSVGVDPYNVGITASFENDGKPSFSVSSDVMKKLKMTKMVFQLNLCDSKYEIRRTFPGYLRGSGEWGWDLPGSFQWGNTLKYSIKSKVKEDDAKRFWTKMVLKHQPTCHARLTEGKFYVSDLMAAIVAEIPDAFSGSKTVSPAFAQMSALNAQMKKAEKQKSEGWQKRKELTQRAWAVLKNDMTAGERRLLAEADIDAPSNAKAIKELDSIFSTAERQLNSGNKKLDANMKKRLAKAVSTYTPAKLTSLKLPKAIQNKLQSIAGRGNDWKDLSPTYDKGSRRWGYKNKSGKWVINPIYVEAKPFIDARALVTVPFGGRQFIEPRGKPIGPIVEDVNRLFNDLGLACVESTGSPSYNGLLNIKTGAWVVAPAKNIRCGGFKRENNSIAYTLNSPYYDSYAELHPYSFYGEGGTKLFEKMGMRIKVRNDQIFVATSLDGSEGRCSRDYYYSASSYSFLGKLISSNEKFSDSYVTICLSKG